MDPIKNFALVMWHQGAAVSKPPGRFGNSERNSREGRPSLRAVTTRQHISKIGILSVAFVCVLAHLAFCDQKIDAQNWQNLGKFNPTTLGKTLGDHVGQLVAVQFNFRGKDIRHIKPNWYEASVWQPDPAEKKGFSNVRVLFAKKDLAKFTSITTDATSRARLTLYGRVERDADSHYYFVRLFGRKATIDSSANANVTW